jgi:hypothetical protein
MKFDLQKFSGFYPFNPNLGQQMQSEVPGIEADAAYVAHLQWSATEAVVGATTAVHAAVNGASGAAVIVTTGFTQPTTPRCLTATAGGTAGDIKATQIIARGFDIAGNALSETLPAFTVDTAGTVQGTKAFAQVTEYEIPIQDGNGATFALGTNDKLGLPYKLSHDTVLKSYRANALEGTAATVTVSATDISLNTVDLNSALNGTVVDVYLLV